MVTVVPALTCGESSNAPIRPPPGPFSPGLVLLGPGRSLQHAVASATLASSNVTTTKVFPALYVGDERILGIHTFSQALIPTRPPSMPPAAFFPTQVSSWPSLHRFGEIIAKFGAVFGLARSSTRWVRGTTFLLQVAWSSMIEWK